MAKTYSFDRYVADARKEPFVLATSDEREIEIPAPTGETVLEIEESRSSRRTLELLCGEHFSEVYDLVRAAPASALNALVADMVEHFGISAAPPGGSVASSR